MSIEKIQLDRPLYLFVDSDIERNFAVDVIDPRISFAVPLQGFSVLRVKELQLLQQVFLAVKDDYELVEQGLLISGLSAQIIIFPHQAGFCR